MTLRFLLLLNGWLYGLALYAQPALSDTSNLVFSSERLRRVDTFLEDQVAQGIVPHAQSLIIHRGRVVHDQTYGTLDAVQNQPLPQNTIWRIASQSKLITTLAAMMLYEEGTFLLEDPIAHYLPAFDSTPVLTTYDSATLAYETRPAARPITIRDLLTHTAGIPYEHPLQEHPDFKVPFFSSLDDEPLEDVVNRIAARPRPT